MRRQFLVTLLLYSTSLFGADPVPQVPTPLVIPMQQFPNPIIIFNYGTYNGGLPTSPPAVQAAPVAPPTLEVAALVPAHVSDEGLRLTLIGGVAGRALNDYVIGAGVDIRFLEYLGIELRVGKGMSNDWENKTAELFVGPKVQLPLKSSLVNFTPSAGAGFGLYEMGSSSSRGLAVFLKAELELGKLFVLAGKVETALAEKDTPKTVYALATTGSYEGDSYYDDYYYPSEEPSNIYSSISVRGGVRVSPMTVLSLEYAVRGFGAAKSPLATFQAEIKF